MITITLPRSVATELIGTLRRAANDAERAATNRDFPRNVRDQAEQDAVAIDALESVISKALDRT